MDSNYGTDIDCSNAGSDIEVELDSDSEAKSIWIDIAELDQSSYKMATAINKLTQYGKAKLGFQPYDWQITTTAAAFCGYDVVAIARTGDGKSAIFQLLTAFPGNIIIISPLLGLIREQVCIAVFPIVILVYPLNKETRLPLCSRLESQQLHLPVMN
jgi:superfamily II DNA helicase RecQ